MITIEWVEHCGFCINEDLEDGDIGEDAILVDKGDTFMVERIELSAEDAEEGNLVTLYLPDGRYVLSVNDNWFKILGE